MRIARSIGAVLAGVAVGAVLSLGTDALLRVAGIFPPFGQPMSGGLFLLATVYRSVYSVLGAYLTAWLAPHKPMKHALILGALGTLVCILGVVATWDKGPDFGPKWYPIALAVLSMPCAWAGGKLKH